MDTSQAAEPRHLLLADSIVAGYAKGIDILQGCHLEVKPGEIVGIIGPNGAGKSTLLKAVFGLVPIRRGVVMFRDLDVTGRPAHELVSLGIGYVPQRSNVFASLTVEENLRMGLYLGPERWNERFAYVTEQFSMLGERRRQRAGSLSGGERQVVAMARALMMDPEVLLLDEPSAGLSPAMQDEVFDHITHVNEEGISVLMVEQNARRCLEIVTHGYVLDQGSNAYEGTGRALLEDPKVTEMYLGTLATSKG